jgi:hypothetical protein
MLGRNAIEVSLAKPLSDKRKQAQVKREQRRSFDPPFNSRTSFGESSQSSGPPSGNLGAFNNPPRGGGGGGGRSDGSFS